jgi:hypothetical protein
MQMFKEDVMKSGGGRSKEPLVDLVVNRSYPDGVEWLMMPYFGLNLTQLAHCGGHSAPRTHRYTCKFDAQYCAKHLSLTGMLL